MTNTFLQELQQDRTYEKEPCTPESRRSADRHKMIQQQKGETLWTAHLPHSRSSWRRSGSRGGSQDRTSLETSQPGTGPETRTLHSLRKVWKCFQGHDYVITYCNPIFVNENETNQTKLEQDFFGCRNSNLATLQMSGQRWYWAVLENEN